VIVGIEPSRESSLPLRSPPYKTKRDINSNMCGNHNMELSHKKYEEARQHDLPKFHNSLITESNDIEMDGIPKNSRV
jgi:hypothetical protein